ncbi:MAG: hypothetical protein RL223_3237 [Pseudomonadota bacterium]|jgi:diguanylate cyclase (GGDEF)-like protein
MPENAALLPSCLADDRQIASPHRRVRVTLWAMLGSVAALATGLYLAWQPLEQQRRNDAELLQLVRDEARLAEQVGRIALGCLLDCAGDRVALVQALEAVQGRSQQHALDLIEQLRLQDGVADAALKERLIAAVDAWQARRERLWYQAEILHQRIDDAAGDPLRLRSVARAAQAAAEPAAAAADTLAQRAQAVLEARRTQALRQMQHSAVALLLLLVLLAVVVGEPTVRMVRRQYRLLGHAVDTAGLGTWVWDMRSGRMRGNDRLLEMLGWPLDEIAPTVDAWSALVHPDDQRRWQAALRAHLQDASAPCRAELRVRRSDGGWSVIDSCGAVLERDAQGRALMMSGINIDLSAERRLQEALALAARTDSLTGLPNRAALFDRVQRVIEARRAGGAGWSLLHLDIDRLKQINDTLGHRVGDLLLCTLAQRLSQLLAPTEGEPPLVGRIGGDEFVVLLSGPDDATSALALAQRLARQLGAPSRLGGHWLSLRLNIGVVTSAQVEGDAEAVLRDADTASQEAKRLVASGGDGCLLFDPALQARLSERALLEHGLRDALREQQLFLVYQPVVPLRDGATLGVEALLRWRHPQRGLIPPLQFIPVAERCGLILEIGEFVLRTACKAFMAWQRSCGPDAPRRMAVNLSPAQLQAPDIVEQVRRALTDAGMPAAALQLEVTESMAVRGDEAMQRLRALKDLGVLIALDDFGTGYSSLACLHQLPVDTVKVDRSFVMHAEASEYHRVLIEATVRVARTLGMTTVAEGIEGLGEDALMRELGCDRGQGYLYARPLPDAELLAWLQARAAATPAAALPPPAAAVSAAMSAVTVPRQA